MKGKCEERKRQSIHEKTIQKHTKEVNTEEEK